jgi:hypothetical protein
LETGGEVDWGATVVPSSDITAQEVEGELLILDLGSSEYYSLNDVGTAMWALMAEGRTLEEVAAEVCSRYEVADEQVRIDLSSLVAALREKGLITLRGPGGEPAA